MNTWSMFWGRPISIPFCRGLITALLSHICSRVKVNGYLSELLRIARSVYQGCPLAALLYMLPLEPLLRKLDISKRIHGRFVSAYEDDVG